MPSRKLDDLQMIVREKAYHFIELCKEVGIELLVTCTYRSNEEQAALYAQGRTAPGRIITGAKPGESFHQYRVALDVVPLVHGKPVWNTDTPETLALWNKVGAIGEKVGLEWAWRWKHNKEMAHFQYTAGHNLEFFKKGGILT